MKFSIGHPLLLILLLLIHNVTTTSAQEEEDESGFNYDENSPKGPSNWGDLNFPKWVACKNGTLQSPIDLSNQTAVSPPLSQQIITFYKPSNAILKNRGHDIALEWTGDAGYIKINNTNYTLQQAHWHTPSEHLINGARYDLERHMVHFNAVINKIAVIGVLYQTGDADPFLSQVSKKNKKKDPFLSQLTGSLKDIVKNNVNETNAAVIDPNDITEGDESFFRYNGSLTTPPCNETVIWTIQKKIRTVSEEQIDLLKDAVHDNAEENARPLQALNNRDVLLYAPEINLASGDTFSNPAYIDTN